MNCKNELAHKDGCLACALERQTKELLVDAKRRETELGIVLAKMDHTNQNIFDAVRVVAILLVIIGFILLAILITHPGLATSAPTKIAG